MRSIAIILGYALALGACSKSSEQAGIEQAKLAADQEAKASGSGTATAAKKLTPPVAGRAKLNCANVIDAAKFQQVLGEADPITVKDDKSEPEAAASCSIQRGGKRPNQTEQAAIMKKNGGKLGVLPGDELCVVSTFCWTIEDPERFQKKCTDEKKTIDQSLGFPACVMMVATGEADVKNWRFYDEDTKCVIGVRAGPSNTDNDLIGKCAKAAHDQIGPTQIVPGAAPAPEAPAAGSGSAK
jgi:hypothetical protein